VAEWLSIEVFDGAFPATLWRNAHGEALVEAALTNGAINWEWPLIELSAVPIVG
jgi:hypothetical protein